MFMSAQKKSFYLTIVVTPDLFKKREGFPSIQLHMLFRRVVPDPVQPLLLLV